MRVIGYVRVSTADQAEEGNGLDAQRSIIQAEADRRGWSVTWVQDAGASGGNLRRPGIVGALAALRRGEQDALVVAKLDRLTRSAKDFADLMALAERQRWAFVAVDLGVDTTTPTGELVAHVMAAIAQWERRMIGLRTKEALAEVKARGVRLGSPVLIPGDVEERIVTLRASGCSYAAIAAELNATATPCGGRGRAWYGSTVRAVCLRRAKFIRQLVCE